MAAQEALPSCATIYTLTCGKRAAMRKLLDDGADLVDEAGEVLERGPVDLRLRLSG